MYVKPKISRKEAEDIFASRKSLIPSIGQLFRKKNQILPEKIEVLYLPFYLFDVLVEKEKYAEKDVLINQQKITVSVDGLLGHSVFYAEDGMDTTKDPEISAVACDFQISASVAAEKALERYRGILLEHGLRSRSYLDIKEISEGEKIFHPFWIGYYRKRKGYDFKAMDAKSGEIQSIQMRRVFIKALKNLEQKDKA